MMHGFPSLLAWTDSLIDPLVGVVIPPSTPTLLYFPFKSLIMLNIVLMQAVWVSCCLKSFWILGSNLGTDSSVRCKTLHSVHCLLISIVADENSAAVPLVSSPNIMSFFSLTALEVLSLVCSSLTMMCLHVALSCLWFPEVFESVIYVFYQT